MAVLTPSWKPATTFLSGNHDVATGDTEGEESDAERPLAEKPMFIYVNGGAEEGFDKIEKVILDDNKILVGMHAFTCIRMTPEEASADPLLAEEGKEDRRFIFVSRDYEDITVLEGARLKTKMVYNTMKKFASKAYKTKFDKVIKGTMKLLLEFDKINGARKNLNQKRERLGADISKSEARKIEKELEELAARQKKAEEERDELLHFELKD